MILNDLKSEFMNLLLQAYKLDIANTNRTV